MANPSEEELRAAREEVMKLVVRCHQDLRVMKVALMDKGILTESDLRDAIAKVNLEMKAAAKPLDDMSRRRH